MKKSWLLFLALPLAVLSTAQAEAVTCPSGGDTTYASYLALGAGGCTIADKTFFGFTHGGDVAASDIDVTIVNDGTNFGFIFQMPLAIIGGTGTGTSVADVALTYNVRVTDGSPRITDVTVTQTSSTSGVAFATVAELVCIGSTLPGCEGGTLVSLDTSDSDPFAQIVFDPVSVVGLSKDFVVAALNCGEQPGCSFASLSVVHNTVSQTVPEPSTLLLLGSALAGVAVWGRKKIK